MNGLDTEKIYTLAALREWKLREPCFAVLGKPIAHSLSPKMHNAALAVAARERGLPELAARRYFRFEIAPEELEIALPLFFEKNFLGLNLTIPHKVAVLPLLKKISSEAENCGAANTLIRSDALGGWRGENTDGRGFALAAEMQVGVKLAGTHVVLLGAGGAARAIASTALGQGCASLTIVNRSRERAETLATALAGEIKILAPDALRKRVFLPETLIVNATPLGLNAGDVSPFPPELLAAGMAVYDTTYGAGESAFVAAARERKIPAADGRAMLAWQGALAFELWNAVPAKAVFPTMFSAVSR